MSGEAEYYAALHGRRIPHIAPDIRKRLTLGRWRKDMSKYADIESMPLFEPWWTPQVEKLFSSEMDEVEMWKRLTALYELLCSDFATAPLDLPGTWLENRINTRSTYSLNDVRNLATDILEIGEWNRNFWDPDSVYDEENPNFWHLQKNLANEFVRDRFLHEVRKLATSTGAKSTVSEIAERDRKLMELVEEACVYDSRPISNAFYEQLPAFFEELKTDSDPGLQHVFTSLKQLFVNDKCLFQWEKTGGLFDRYFDHLKSLNTKKEHQRIVDTVHLAVSNYLQKILGENEKLRNKILSFEVQR